VIASLRESYGKALERLGEDNKDIVVLDADLSSSTMSKYFERRFPERFFEMGISEQNMVSVGVGLSLTGKTVFVNSFSVFITGRAYDQVRVGVALGEANVKLVGSSAGLSDYDDGATHQSIEDISLMRSLPNMTVLVPSDVTEVRKMTEYISNYKKPVYLRISKEELPLVFDDGWDYKIGKLYKIKEGNDAVIFTNGSMVHRSLSASLLLEKEGISVGVVNVSTVKPFNKEEVIKIALKVKKIVVVEEHSIIGGLGSAILEALYQCRDISIKLVGIEDKFGMSACNVNDLMTFYGLTENNIVSNIKDLLK